MFSTEETAWDIRFGLFGIPVRVHPGFWVAALLLGCWVDGALDLTVVRVAVVFVSILAHELGHALAARSFGWPPSILLYHFGGLAFFQPHRGYTRGRAMWIAFAGPLAGFVLFGLTMGFIRVIEMQVEAGAGWAINMAGSQRIGNAINFLVFVNLFWGLVNLLPVLPLDGGRIFAEIVNARGSRRGLRTAHLTGALTAGAVAAWFFSQQSVFNGLLFASFAWENWQQAQQTRPDVWS